MPKAARSPGRSSPTLAAVTPSIISGLPLILCPPSPASPPLLPIGTPWTRAGSKSSCWPRPASLPKVPNGALSPTARTFFPRSAPEPLMTLCATSTKKAVCRRCGIALILKARLHERSHQGLPLVWRIWRILHHGVSRVGHRARFHGEAHWRFCHGHYGHWRARRDTQPIDGLPEEQVRE